MSPCTRTTAGRGDWGRAPGLSRGWRLRWWLNDEGCTHASTESITTANSQQHHVGRWDVSAPPARTHFAMLRRISRKCHVDHHAGTGTHTRAHTRRQCHLGKLASASAVSRSRPASHRIVIVCVWHAAHREMSRQHRRAGRAFHGGMRGVAMADDDCRRRTSQYGLHTYVLWHWSASTLASLVVRIVPGGVCICHYDKRVWPRRHSPSPPAVHATCN